MTVQRTAITLSDEAAGAFAGKAVLVTGGASGIGRAIAQRFTNAGANVVVADTQEPPAGALDDVVGWARCDVGQPADVEAAVRSVVETHGGLDVMVNNAGFDLVGSLSESSADDAARIAAVNFLGVFYGIRYAAPELARRGGGAIVSTASVAGLGGTAGTALYSATKAAVISLTQSAALELRPLNIRVNCVCPGFIDTPMLGRQRTELEELAGMSMDYVVAAKQGRYGTPDEVAHAALYLASEDASFVSGVALPVDNALSAGAF